MSNKYSISSDTFGGISFTQQTMESDRLGIEDQRGFYPSEYHKSNVAP